MKYGLIGKKLSHSFSVEVHSMINKYPYSLCELSEDEFSEFMRDGNFLGINVTIPYKIDCIPYLSELSESARELGSVNTVVKRDGSLIGYNTDYLGFSELVSKTGVSIDGKKCVILGTGGASLATLYALKKLRAREIYRVSRTKRDGAISYEELYSEHLDAEIIVNATPVGMYPDTETSPIELSRFKKLLLVLDLIYNPIRTKLLQSAGELCVPAYSGLYMLVSQAVLSAEIFLNEKQEAGLLEKIYRKLLFDKENIVLTGMPSSGKSTVGRIVADALSRGFFDTDTLIEEKTGLSIPEIFEKYGEEYFRNIESDVIREISRGHGLVISTGGGAVLRAENVRALRSNGRIFFLDRSKEKLLATDNRPLSRTREAVFALYENRISTYRKTADVIIDADADAKAVADKIIREVQNENEENIRA